MPKLLLSFDQYEIAEREAEFQLEWQEENNVEEVEDIDTVRESVYQDWVFWETEAESLKDELTELMAGREYWKLNGSEMGWRKLRGEKYVMAETGEELLQAVLPNCDCTWWLYKYGKGFKMKVSHHDAPMGEHYVIMPCAESTYEKNNY